MIIKKDVPLEFNFADLELEEPDVDLLMKLCQVVEFKTLTDKIAAFAQESPKGGCHLHAEGPGLSVNYKEIRF